MTLITDFDFIFIYLQNISCHRARNPMRYKIYTLNAQGHNSDNKHISEQNDLPLK